VRPDTMLAGIFDPQRRLDRSRARQLLVASLSSFGTVSVFDEGALVVASADPRGRRSEATGEPVLCLIDGYLEASVGPTTTQGLSAAWQARGPAVLPNLRGAFTAVLWDRARQRGCVVRDQLGQRPAFLFDASPVFYFATEVRPLLGLLPRRPAPDPVAVARFLGPSDMREDRVLYEGVRRLPGGHVLTLEDGPPRLQRFWEPRYKTPRQGSPAELAIETRDQVAGAVRRSLGTVERAGLLLSGGLDSTTVAAFAAPEMEARGSTLVSYSNTFPTHPTMDETPQIEAVVRRFGLAAHRQAVFGGSALASTLESLDSYWLPEVSPNGFFLRPLMRHSAGHGMQLLLTGEGGDNVFSTPLYLMADRVSRGRLLDALRLVERFPNIAYHPWRSLRLRLLRDFGVIPLLPEPVHRSLALRRETVPAYLNDHARRLLADGVSARPWQALDGPRWWAEKADHFGRRIGAIGAPELTTRAARLGGVAERHPLLSLDLVEFALRLPPEQQFDPHRNRPALRRATEGVLPDAVRLRSDKVTFDALRGQSIQSDYDIVRNLLGSDARIGAYTRREVVAALLDRSPERWGDLSVWSGHLMRLVVAECWLRQQEEPSFARELLEAGRLTPAELQFEPFPDSFATSPSIK
jgi:asparagine synthase (glutamine-hydrolysing)